MTYIKQQIEKYKRHSMVRLLAVSKGQAVEKMKQLQQLGQYHFGENYVQEALIKMDQFKHVSPMIWHFTGKIQSNKTRLISEKFDWVHTVDNERIAVRLNAGRINQAPLNVCIQIKMSTSLHRGGIGVNDVFALAKTIMAMPALELRGLMIMPELMNQHDIQNKANLQSQYEKWFHYYIQFQQHFGSKIDTLSMGMSYDRLQALKAGSNLVRIGTALFGSRI
ncbi:MAG: YggS family pyridoxal phosphate-dependent enzyme [Endozoicomonadaceae bacterium]|nr:YggS family pyridoxal phosphate-dependent enzyme [Endozoicomonadaceae bacterium]MBE8232771.1 YggS family pyridoxal phosphate-dependent enzyme [Endozoicomonadaceae bacterium]